MQTKRAGLFQRVIRCAVPSSPSRRMSLPLYHSHYRSRGTTCLARLQRREFTFIVLLLVLVALFSGAQFLYYTHSLTQAKSIASKLHLTTTFASDKQLAQLNKYLARLTVDDVLLWAHTHFHDELVDLTSFGPSGLVILHKLHQLGLLKDVPVVTIDTLHLFPDTYDFIETLKHSDLLNHVSVQTYRPKNCFTRQEFEETYGANLWKLDPDQYAYHSKVEPTLRALDETHAVAWLTGRRRSQGGERTFLPILQVDDTTASPRYKINPLAFWSYEQVWKYIRHYNIPYNKLHDEGYKSIGDFMTTAPVDAKAAERSGRFVGLHTSECGIHATRAKIQRMKQQAEKEGHVFDGMPELACGDNCLQVTAFTFDEIVLEGTTDLLLEFYSPLCGACQAFAPEFDTILEKLQPFQQMIQMARFDVTEEDVPESGQEAGFVVEMTPSLFLVRRDPFRVLPYDGRLKVSAVLEWIQGQYEGNLNME